MLVEPGTAGFSNIRVRPRRGFWRGTPKTRPFKVAVSAQGQAPMTLDGTMVQEALLPGWLIPALLALLGLVILAIVLWATVLQPSIKSAATQALADAGFTPIPAGAGGAPNGGGAGTSPTSGTPAPSGGSVLTPPPSPSAGTGTGTGGFPGHPVDGRLSVDGTNPTGVTASKTTLYVTDLVFANPNGRAGTLNLKRGTLTIITLRLENFRDLDYHFVTPVVIPNGQSLVLAATCTSSGPCDPSVFFSGYTNP